MTNEKRTTILRSRDAHLNIPTAHHHVHNTMTHSHTTHHPRSTNPSTQRIGTLRDHSAVKILKRSTPIVQRRISSFLDRRTTRRVSEQYIVKEREDTLFIKLETHPDLVYSTLHFSFQNQSHKQIFNLINLNVDLLQRA